mmetsp:Transcript_89179/g.257101  ORF Transcript_89179/g.257101 Transcript_89179/m.257101 type:complete len:201 (-) Transcript_89179:131-733(-)
MPGGGTPGGRSAMPPWPVDALHGLLDDLLDAREAVGGRLHIAFGGGPLGAGRGGAGEAHDGVGGGGVLVRGLHDLNASGNADVAAFELQGPVEVKAVNERLPPRARHGRQRLVHDLDAVQTRVSNHVGVGGPVCADELGDEEVQQEDAGKHRVREDRGVEDWDPLRIVEIGLPKQAQADPEEAQKRGRSGEVVVVDVFVE